MGKLDIVTKQYMEDRRIFADAFNYSVYDGEPIVQPEQLRPLDVVSTATPDGTNPMQKTRDVLKCLAAMEDDNRAYVILGIENQSDIHYAMPVRNLVYDALTYEKQVKDIAAKHRANKDSCTNAEYLSGFHKKDKLMPVITLVIYFGAEKWDGPTSLHEMMDLDQLDDKLRQFIADYKLLLLTPADIMPEDFVKFHTNLGHVLKFIKYSKDKETFDKLRHTQPYRNIDRNAALVLKNYLHLNIKIDEENTKENVDMCNAMDELLEDSRLEGEAKGKTEGKAEGKSERSTEIAKNLLLEKTISCETIAKCSGLSLTEIQKLAEQLECIA